MIGSVQRQIARGMGQVRQTFLGVVARGGSKMLQLTGLADEVLDETELVQQVGFSSYIPEGCRVVVIPLQGKTSRSIVIATDGAPIVIHVLEGETCIYDQFGHSVWLKEDGTHIAGDLFVMEKSKPLAMSLIRKALCRKCAIHITAIPMAIHHSQLRKCR